MDYSQFIKPQVLILVIVIYAIGMLLKGIKKIPDGYIPWILLVPAIALCIFLLGFNVDAIIQGVLVTMAAVYGNQLIKQTQEVVGVQKNTDPTVNQLSDPPNSTDSQK